MPQEGSFCPGWPFGVTLFQVTLKAGHHWCNLQPWSCSSWWNPAPVPCLWAASPLGTPNTAASRACRRILTEVCSCVCVVIYTEMKIPDQHSASSCGLISVIHNLLVLGEIKAVTSRRSPQTTHRILHLSVYKHPSSPLCWEVCGIYLQLSHLLHFRKLGTDSTLSSADLLPTACHFTLSGWWQTPWFIQHGGLERFYSGKRKLYWVPSLLKYPEEAAKGLTETACTMSQYHSNCSQHA